MTRKLLIILSLPIVLLAASCGEPKPRADKKQQPKVEAASKEVTLTLTSPLLCSKSILGIDTLARVRAGEDLAGAMGLVARDKALVLEAGTTIFMVTHSPERASLYVDSGPLVGESCWIQPGWINVAAQRR